MSATLNLDKFKLMWLFEGACGRSHLRWDIYEMFVNDIFPQLDDAEREFLYTYIKRDTSWHWENKEYRDQTPYEYWQQVLARFNPANQYRITMKKGREKKVVEENAYLWDGKFYVAWNRFCDSQYIKNVEHKPYKKCVNNLCKSKNMCLRFNTFKEGDDVSRDNPTLWNCDRCDLIIEGKENE